MFIENKVFFQTEENVYGMPEQDNSRHLWISVLERAILDLEYVDLRERALAWIKSRRESIGSFAWICSYIGLDPNKAREAVLATSFATTLPTEYWDKGRYQREMKKKTSFKNVCV